MYIQDVTMMEPTYYKDGIRLYNADALDVMRSLPDESIDLVCTDPPYHITKRGNAGTMGGYMKSRRALSGRIFNNNDISCADYIPEFYRLLKDGTHCYIMCNHVNLVEMLNTALSCGFRFTKSLIWNKCNPICGRFYMNCFEYVLMFRKGAGRVINDCSTPDILSIPISKMRDSDGHNLHDTEKPVDLMKVLIGNSTNEGETVLEPFAGIGSTMVAAKMLGRKCIGCEIDPKYADITRKRLEDSTNVSLPAELFLM